MKTALVLCGGGSKGAFEVGVLKVLLQHWMPDIVLGTSVGAINGAFILDGPNIYENLLRLEQLWQTIGKRDFFNFNKSLLYKFHLASSFYANSNMRAFLGRNLRAKRFEDLAMPLYVNCTRLRDGHNIFFHKGEMVNPIVASCTYPPLLPPVQIGGDSYFDGGLGSYIGIDLLRQNKYKKIVIVSLVTECDQHNSKNIIDLSWNSIEIIRRNLIHREIELCKGKDIVTISPVLKQDVHLLDFSHTRDLIRLGEEEMDYLVKKIRF